MQIEQNFYFRSVHQTGSPSRYSVPKK